MIRIAPIAITAQSKAGGMELLLFAGWEMVNVVCGWVIVIIVEVGVGNTIVPLPLPVEVGTGAAAVVKKKVDQALVTVPLVARTLHLYWVL